MKQNDRLATIIAEEIKKADIIDAIKKEPEFEKKVKKIVSDVICDMFRVLWQHNGIFKVLSN